MEELLSLAIEDPETAWVTAEQVLAESPGPLARSYAHQCLGIVLRDRGQTEPALLHLRTALRAALATDVPDRVRDVRASYGATLVLCGRSRSGLAQLERAAHGATGEVGAKIAMRMAASLTVLGRYREAVPGLQRALDGIQQAGDGLWEARTRVWLAHAHRSLGRVDRAEQELHLAERKFIEASAHVERLSAVESLAEVSVLRGDLAGGMRRYGEVMAGYAAAAREPRFEAVRLHAMTCLAAGLPADAVALLDRFEDGVSLPPHEAAELQLSRAAASLAAADLRGALNAADRAREMFSRQRRDWFALRAGLIAVQARDQLGGAFARGLRRSAGEVAGALHEEHADEAPVALVHAGRLTGGDDRLALWLAAASYRTHPNALVRAGAWRARALSCEETGDRGGVLRAAAAGLDAIDEHRRLIGSSELRALATTHGRELTTVALRHAASDPRTLLRWSERTRATALAQPPVTSDAATVPASLAALRDNGRRLAEARQEGEPTEGLERERLRLERAVRAESHTLSAETAAQQRPVAVEEIVSEVGEGCLVELVDVDGALHVLVVHAGRVRRRVTATTAEVAELVGPTEMLLRRASRGRPADLTALGRQLQEAILGDAVRLLPDGPVVLAPTARLHGLPWALLPALHDRPFSVVPSAGQWLRARATPRPAARNRRTVLVSGPGLATGGAEVPLLAARLSDPHLIAGAGATLEAVLDALDGADLVHLAAHGSFRADSPLFSSLELADGPLTVHDLERVRRAPYRVVLSACESGVLAPVGAEELLGLTAALFSLGTAGLVSSVAEVHDSATADLMVDLHATLADGHDPATALHAVRRAAVPGSVEAATAAAFLALGV